ncbi:MAG: hypothetical protein B7C24_16705 [Bacteroidetes bacterium 4572_77]|nr:MAG: hypothetical protein B7C24_16705 [Bacteroidetes bacterium 4572_77]
MAITYDPSGGTVADGNIEMVSGTSGTPATFEDIYDADKVGTLALETRTGVSTIDGSTVSCDYNLAPADEIVMGGDKNDLKIIITNWTGITSVTIQMTGTSESGTAQTEDITVTANGTFNLTKLFKTLTTTQVTAISGTGSFDYVLQQDQWGVCSRNDSTDKIQYRFDCDITFGDGSNDWYFKDTEKDVYCTGQFLCEWAGSSGTHIFMLGELNNGSPINGCTIRIPNQSTYFPSNSGSNSCNLYLYACILNIDTFWRHYGEDGLIAVVKNCMYINGRGFRIGGIDSVFTGNVLFNISTYGLTTISPTPLIENNRSYHSSSGVYHAASISGDCEILDLVMSDNTQAIYETNNDYTYLNLINCTSDVWNIVWSGSTDQAMIYRKYSYTILITDEDNVDITNPVVALYDKFYFREFKKSTGALKETESFESGWGNWTTNTSEGAGALWSRHSGSTASSGTGPDSASDGSYYLYCETSNPNNPSKIFDLYLECVEASTIQFDYMLRWPTHSWTTNPKIEVHEWTGSAWNLIISITTPVTTSSTWTTTSELALDNTTRIRIRATGGDGGGNLWHGDMAVDKIIISDLVTEITGLQPIYGHYIQSEGSSINQHGPQKLRIRKYGYYPSSALKEFVKEVYEKNSLREDNSVTQSISEATAHTGIVITEALSNRNLALSIDPQNDSCTTKWNNSNVSVTRYNTSTPSPFPTHYNYTKEWIISSSGTTTDYFEIDVSDDSIDIDNSNVDYSWNYYASLSSTSGVTAVIGLSFRNSSDTEISNDNVTISNSGSLTEQNESGTIPVNTRTIRITLSIVNTDGTNRYLYFAMPRLILTNSEYDNFGIKIDCGGNNLEDVWHYLQQGISKYDDFQGRDGIDWHNMLLRDGSNFKTSRGDYKDSVEIVIQRGVKLSNFSTGTITEYIKDDGTSEIPPTSVDLLVHTITITGADIQNCHVRLMKVSDDSVVLGGLTDIDGNISDNYNYTSDVDVYGWVRKGTTAPFYKQSQLSGTITISGYTTNVTMVEDA